MLLCGEDKELRNNVSVVAGLLLVIIMMRLRVRHSDGRIIDNVHPLLLIECVVRERNPWIRLSSLCLMMK